MNKMLSLCTLLIFCACAHVPALQAQGVDELMALVDAKAEDYRFLAEQISDISDDLVNSENELDSKGDELNQLAVEITETVNIGNSLYEALQNEMDTFESGCFKMLEEKCPELEKEINKFTWKIEPAVELGAEPGYILSEIDNRYDEKFILKTLAKANKAALKVASELEALKEGLMSLAEKCN